MSANKAEIIHIKHALKFMISGNDILRANARVTSRVTLRNFSFSRPGHYCAGSL